MKHIILIILSIVISFALPLLIGTSFDLYDNYVEEMRGDRAFDLWVCHYIYVVWPVVVLSANLSYALIRGKTSRLVTISLIYLVLIFLCV